MVWRWCGGGEEAVKKRKGGAKEVREGEEGGREEAKK